MGLINDLFLEIYINVFVCLIGKIGIVKLFFGDEIIVEEVVDYCLFVNILFIKFMSIEGMKYLDELVYLIKIVVDKGIYGIELVGGIGVDNIFEIIIVIKFIGIFFYMLYIFGKIIDKVIGWMKLEEIEKIFVVLEGN